VLIGVRDDRLALTTLRFADEVRPTTDVPTPPKKAKPSKQQIDQAVALVEALSCEWDPSRYEDAYEKRLKKIVQRTRKGQTVKAPEREPVPSPVPDIMAALEKTLAEVKSGDRTPAGSR
jgi:DNA end-binding protein Ku